MKPSCRRALNLRIDCSKTSNKGDLLAILGATILVLLAVAVFFLAAFVDAFWGQMAFKPSLPKSGWRIWTPDDGEGDNQDFPTLKTFFLGGAEDGHHGMHTTSDLEEKVTSPSGQEYRLCWRFRHWAFYEAVDGIITH